MPPPSDSRHNIHAHVGFRQIHAHQSTACNSVAHVAPKFPIRATTIDVDATRPRAEGVDDGQVRCKPPSASAAVPVPSFAAQVALADGQVPLPVALLDDILAVVGDGAVDRRGDGRQHPLLLRWRTASKMPLSPQMQTAVWLSDRCGSCGAMSTLPSTRHRTAENQRVEVVSPQVQSAKARSICTSTLPCPAITRRLRGGSPSALRARSYTKSTTAPAEWPVGHLIGMASIHFLKHDFRFLWV